MGNIAKLLGLNSRPDISKKKNQLGYVKLGVYSLSSEPSFYDLHSPSIVCLQNWWRADSLGLSEGSSVDTLTDLAGTVGFNTNYTSTGSARPTYQLASIPLFNGWPALLFDGVDDYMLIGTYGTQLTTFSMFIVFMQATTPSSDTPIFDSLIAGASGMNLSITESQIHVLYDRITSAPGTNLTVNFPELDLGPIIVYISYDGATNTLKVYPMSGSISTVVTTDECKIPLTLFLGYNDDALVFGNSYIAEQLIYCKVLTESERTQTRDYLNAKYGLSAAV